MVCTFYINLYTKYSVCTRFHASIQKCTIPFKCNHFPSHYNGMQSLWQLNVGLYNNTTFSIWFVLLCHLQNQGWADFILNYIIFKMLYMKIYVFIYYNRFRLCMTQRRNLYMHCIARMYLLWYVIHVHNVIEWMRILH